MRLKDALVVIIIIIIVVVGDTGGVFVHDPGDPRIKQ